ncbi:glycosyltransferase [Agrococcus sp. ProA11]|uniref:glycosyltransferase n=1 Tax=Agrococcus chionoecetis TaxID=3153752 RepID=UPI00325FE2ED
MTGAEWLNIGETVLVVVLVAMVLIGAVPAFVMASQFLLVPVHGFVNHLKRSAPTSPRVAVIVPAWNEGAVLAESIDRLMRLEYPDGRLRIYVVDDASTDDTPQVVQAKALQYPGAVFHLRREVGGEGKSHTLNHGIRHVMADDWMEALLIMDADVIYLPDSLRKMTRHLADPEVGAVTAYIREGSADKNYLSRFVSFEYVLGQLGSRRAQNVGGAITCLAGGAQLHTRRNIEDLGGAIDTSSLAEDTVTTFETQLSGKRVVFEPLAVVLAEEPQRVGALWKQRLRWARGNVQITKRYRDIWFRPSSEHRLGSIFFGLAWFGIYLLPVFMIMASIGLISLYVMESPISEFIFRSMWIVVGAASIYTITLAAMLDPGITRTAWREVVLFPGVLFTIVVLSAFFPGLFTELVPSLFGLRMTETGIDIWYIAIYAWISLCILGAWGVKKLDEANAPEWLMAMTVYLLGYGPILVAITFDSYVKEAQGAAMVWDKTEKTGRVMA